MKEQNFGIVSTSNSRIQSSSTGSFSSLSKAKNNRLTQKQVFQAYRPASIIAVAHPATTPVSSLSAGTGVAKKTVFQSFKQRLNSHSVSSSTSTAEGTTRETIAYGKVRFPSANLHSITATGDKSAELPKLFSQKNVMPSRNTDSVTVKYNRVKNPNIRTTLHNSFKVLDKHNDVAQEQTGTVSRLVRPVNVYRGHSRSILGYLNSRSAVLSGPTLVSGVANTSSSESRISPARIFLQGTIPEALKLKLQQFKERRDAIKAEMQTSLHKAEVDMADNQLEQELENPALAHVNTTPKAARQKRSKSTKVACLASAPASKINYYGPKHGKFLLNKIENISEDLDDIKEQQRHFNLPAKFAHVEKELKHLGKDIASKLHACSEESTQYLNKELASTSLETRSDIKNLETLYKSMQAEVSQYITHLSADMQNIKKQSEEIYQDLALKVKQLVDNSKSLIEETKSIKAESLKIVDLEPLAKNLQKVANNPEEDSAIKEKLLADIKVIKSSIKDLVLMRQAAKSLPNEHLESLKKQHASQAKNTEPQVTGSPKVGPVPQNSQVPPKVNSESGASKKSMQDYAISKLLEAVNTDCLFDTEKKEDLPNHSQEQVSKPASFAGNEVASKIESETHSSEVVEGCGTSTVEDPFSLDGTSASVGLKSLQEQQSAAQQSPAGVATGRPAREHPAIIKSPPVLEVEAKERVHNTSDQKSSANNTQENESVLNNSTHVVMDFTKFFTKTND